MSEPIATTTTIPRDRAIYCNRTLNLRAIGAIGYDMDYTLVHYHVAAWERRAYEHVRARLVARGWPCAGSNSSSSTGQPAARKRAFTWW